MLRYLVKRECIYSPPANNIKAGSQSDRAGDEAVKIVLLLPILVRILIRAAEEAPNYTADSGSPMLSTAHCLLPSVNIIIIVLRF
jgi:hypothetical protein